MVNGWILIGDHNVGLWLDGGLGISGRWGGMVRDDEVVT